MIALDLETITMIQGVGISIWESGSFHRCRAAPAAAAASHRPPLPPPFPTVPRGSDHHPPRPGSRLASRCHPLTCCTAPAVVACTCAGLRSSGHRSRASPPAIARAHVVRLRPPWPHPCWVVQLRPLQSRFATCHHPPPCCAAPAAVARPSVDGLNTRRREGGRVHPFILEGGDNTHLRGIFSFRMNPNHHSSNQTPPKLGPTHSNPLEPFNQTHAKLHIAQYALQI
jgi:hypothetical protein